MTQLALVGLDPLRDELTEAERATVEARIADDDQARGRYAQPARPCRCERPWPFTPGRCLRCGHDTRRRAEVRR